MSDASSLVRALLIYGILPAFGHYLGYLLATPMDTMSFALLGMLFGVLAILNLPAPARPLADCDWNANMLHFFCLASPTFATGAFVPGQPHDVGPQHILNKSVRVPACAVGGLAAHSSCHDGRLGNRGASTGGIGLADRTAGEFRREKIPSALGRCNRLLRHCARRIPPTTR